MTLRGRLTSTFLVVVLAPVLVGAFFVGSTVSAVAKHRSTERLNLAAAAARTSVNALCQELRAAVDAIAVLTETDRPGAASQITARGVAAGVVITDAAGRTVFTTPGAPPAPWTDCSGDAPPGTPVHALAARVELRDPAGATLGSVTAAQVVDTAFVARLARVTGAAVTVLDNRFTPAAVLQTTEPVAARDAVVAAAAGLAGDRVGATDDGRYVRRIDPSPGQPLPLVLSVRTERPQGLYASLVAIVLLGGLLAILVAWRLARSTTRPLAELAHAVERVAQGDLTARVPVRSHDEVAQLARTFNRMIRETRSYVQALTRSRDQLRGHLAVLGDTLASTHDLPRILRVILRSALAATGARAGLVLLLDPATGTLVPQCGEGLDGRWPDGSTEAEALRIPVGYGVLGLVAATGEPQRGRLDLARPPISRYDPPCRTFVAVPFARPGDTGGDAPAGRPGGAGAVLGVLALYDRLGSDEFDDADLVTLRTFAGHAAVAVENVRLHQEAQRLSLTDPLTGLWNYRYLKESLRREIERANRFGRMLSVLVLDLDRFKEVNDTYGHAAGDVVLAEFARRIRREIREVDLAFRQGGEEFVVLLPETDARGAVIVAERLGAAIRDTPILVEPHPGSPSGAPAPITVTVSIGIAVYPDHAATGQQVLDAADDALYLAKGAGRDTYRTAVPGSSADGEVIVAAAGVPEDAPPRAVGPAAPGGASSGPHPPRQSRGR